MTSINTATIEQLERLIDSAKYSVDSHEREIIRHQTDLEIDPEDSWSKKQIVEANKDLVKAKHRLRVFTSRLEELKSVNAPFTADRKEMVEKVRDYLQKWAGDTYQVENLFCAGAPLVEAVADFTIAELTAKK